MTGNVPSLYDLITALNVYMWDSSVLAGRRETDNEKGHVQWNAIGNDIRSKRESYLHFSHRATRPANCY